MEIREAFSQRKNEFGGAEPRKSLRQSLGPRKRRAMAVAESLLALSRASHLRKPSEPPSAEVSRQRRKAVLTSSRDPFEIREFFARRRKEISKRRRKKRIIGSASQKKPKPIKNRFCQNKIQKQGRDSKGRPRGKLRSKSLNSNARPKPPKQRRASRKAKLRPWDFLLSSICRPEKKPARRRSPRLEALAPRPGGEGLRLFSFKRHKKAGRKAARRPQKLTLSKIKLSWFLLHNFTSIKSIQAGFCDFRPINNGRLCMIFEARQRSSSTRVLIKSYEIALLKPPALTRQFMVGLTQFEISLYRDLGFKFCPKLLHTYFDAHYIFLVLEWSQGETFRDMVSHPSARHQVARPANPRRPRFSWCSSKR